MRGRDAPWDTFSDTWVATDGRGRRVATNAEVGGPRDDRWVGMFYFLWHGARSEGGPWDISRILANDPAAMGNGASPPWGPLHAFHHWGEPLFGYYRGDDRWVLRRHAGMLADAGVDTLVFDVSNKLIFEQQYTALFETLRDVRRDGREQMAVGVSQNAIRDPAAPPAGDSRGLRTGSMSEAGSLGRSFTGGRDDGRPGAVLNGLNFAEQWTRALREDPRFVFVTGWNEWIGERRDGFMGVRQPVMFVDTFDQEHSRDIEPMKGGHGDAYYYQLVDAIRRYKGARAVPPASAPRTIDLAGSFRQWDEVRPEYRDAVGDTRHRDHPGCGAATRYVDAFGRNDVVSAKVACDARSLWFYVRTRERLTPCTDTGWMNLFVDVDRDAATGWLGYDVVVNRLVRGPGTAGLEWTRAGWNWQPRVDVRFRVEECELMVEIPRRALGLPEGGAPVAIEFTWADNLQRDDDADQFLLSGDCAPSGRFNYLYEAGAG